MKTRQGLIRRLYANALVVFLLAGCSSKTVTTPSSLGSMSATVGGAAFNAVQVDGIYSQSLHLMGVFGIAVKGNDSTKLILEFPYLPAVGHTFSSDSTETSLSFFTGGKEYDAFSNSGRVLLTLSAADTVKDIFTGTFSATVYNQLNFLDSLVITNGKFNSMYSVHP
ncbi:MAG TPA: hypothetical protein VHE54_03735 [Puia sp.]|nr:hypothetical protein [Puia sp.]